MYKTILAIVLVAFVSLPVLAQATATSDSGIPGATSSPKSSQPSSSLKKMKKKYAVPSRSTLKGTTQSSAFTSSASTITPRYIVTNDGGSPSGDIQGSLTANTNDVLLQSFNIRAENADLKLQKLPVILYMQKGSLTGHVPAAIKSVSLYIDGQKIASESPTNPYVTFGSSYKLQYPLSVAHGDYKVQIRVDLNDFEDSTLSTIDFDPGDKVSSWYSSLKVLETVVEESTNGKLLTSTQKIGESKGALRAVVLSGDCTPASAPSIKVLYPNGGEVFTGGQQVNIKWSSCNVPATNLLRVNIRAGGQTGGIPAVANSSSDVLNDGSELFTLPAAWPFPQVSAVNAYKISITPINPSIFGVTDLSDSDFKINYAPQGALSYVIGTGTVNTNNLGSNYVQTSDTAHTEDVKTLAFNIMSNNGDSVLQKIPVTFRVQGGLLDTIIPSPQAIFKIVHLYADGYKLASEGLGSGCIIVGSNTCTVIFGNTSKLNYKLPANTQVEFSVRVDLNDKEDSQNPDIDFDQDDMMRVLLTSKDVGHVIIESGVNLDKVPFQSDQPVVGFIQIFR
jgi:hypothetical protein